jgi:CHAD domain-containing protein
MADAAALVLELALPPEAASALPRVLAPKGTRRPRQRATVHIVWHDTPSGQLAEAGQTLAERRQGRETQWLLERLWPEEDAIAPAGVPAAAIEVTSGHVAGQLIPVAGFEGRSRRLAVPDAAGLVEASLLEGVLRAAAGSEAVCRLTLTGKAGEVVAVAHAVAAALPAAVPRASLAAEARATARHALPPRRLGAPQIPGGLSVSDACAFVCGHLADVIQHHARHVGDGLEPVHQMRVAVRRLRSALALFRRAVACPELETVNAGLRALGRVLGPARDWDVFIAGTGQAVGAAFPADPAVARLLAAAARRRGAAYAALRAHLAGPGFRQLGISLAAVAACPPWRDFPEEDADREKQLAALASDLHVFAAHALSRRLGRVLAAGEDVEGLPEAELHEIRLHAKRLRYAAEIFAPLYARKDTQRFLRRLAELQETLGHLNDGAVASALMAELGAAGGRSFAAGVVCGFVAARAGTVREDIGRVWKRLARADIFWD